MRRPPPPTDAATEALLADARLAPLRRAAAAPGSERELAGRVDALRSYRAAQRPRPARRRHLTWSRGLAVIAAVSLGGVGTAAYASVLPRPAQRDLHHIFAAIGVPAPTGHARSTSAHPVAPTAPARGRDPLPVVHHLRRPGQVRPVPVPGHPATTNPAPTLRARAVRVRDGGTAVLVIRTGRAGGPTRVEVVARPEGGRVRLLRSLVVPPSGVVRLRVGDLHRNTVFALEGANGRLLARTRVTVFVPVALRAERGADGRIVLAVSVGASSVRTAELERHEGGRWAPVETIWVDRRFAAVTIAPGAFPAGTRLRVRIPAGPTYAASTSRPVVVPVSAIRRPAADPA